jgi:cyclic pyranopterin monophosphate synthase
VTEFSHLDDEGGKPLSRRHATAKALLTMASETASRLRELPKGDALTTAQVAGVMAAKRTSELIPLCHPLPLTKIDVQVRVVDDGAEVVSTVETTAQTGVEMEALVAASVAALTLYDMAKAVDDSMTLSQVQLLEKTKEPA